MPEGNPMALGAFYACVTLLADIVSTLSVKAYRWKDGAKIAVEPQPRLFADSPYPDVTWFSWLWMMMESLAVTGNAFGYVTDRGEDGRPTAIMPIHPDRVNIKVDEDGLWPDPVYFFEGKRVPLEDVVHIKRFPIAGCAWGMSPVEKAAAAIGLGLAAERYGLRYFRDSANPSGILSTDSDLSPEQAKRAQMAWLASHRGRRLPAVLSGGLKWQSVTLTPNESQFLETRQFQRSEIAMWFRIPPHMIGDTTRSTSWGTGIEEMTLGFMKFTLQPWLTCIEQALTAFLPRGQFAKFNIDDLLRGDIKTRWEAYWLGRQAGVYSVNDIRDFEDLPPVENGDIRLQPANFVPLGTDPTQLTQTPVAGDEDGEKGSK
ncbi:Gp13 [Mycolicibacterium phlei]|nr:Gp13 [Mycolicibacterium phlei]